MMEMLNRTDGHHGIRIVPVESSGLMKQFINLPYRLYRHHEQWIPPFRFMEKRRLDAKYSDFLKRNKAQLFMAFRDGSPVGRISAHLNRRHNEIYQDHCGFIGFFECLHSHPVAEALFDSARDWLRQNHCSSILGPVNFTINDEAGLLAEGFRLPPSIFMPYHPPYYRELWEKYGFQLEKQHYAWHFDRNSQLHPLVLKIASTAEKTPGLIIRKFRKDRLPDELKRAYNVYSNAWQPDWGNYPPDAEDFENRARNLAKLSHPDFAWIAEINDEPIGVCLALPNINEIPRNARGSFGPLSYLRLRHSIRHPRSLRILVIELDHRFLDSGIDASLYRKIRDQAFLHNVDTAEVSWIQAQNGRMNKLMEKSGGRISKKYNLYRLNFI